MSQIHPTAIVEKGAKIGKNVQIGPHAIIGPNVCLEDDVDIKAGVIIDGYTKVGQGTTIWPYAVIGTKTQDLKFRGEKTYVEIGKKCEIREFVTINSSCGEETSVKVGDMCLIMAYCHIAHNCILGNRVIMVNNVALAGHVTVEDCAVLGGHSAVHQFSRIGCYAMVGGMSRVTHDVPPYTIGAGSPYRVGGLNLIGLKRHGFDLKTRKMLAQAFRSVYRAKATLNDSLNVIEQTLEQIPEVAHFVAFCRATKRGLIALEGVTTLPEDGASVEDAEELETANK